MAPPAGEPWQLVTLAVDAAVVYFLRRWYQSKFKNAEAVENATSYSLTDDFRKSLDREPNKTLPYACVEGKVQALDRPITSQYAPTEQGVIQKLMFIEHKSKRSNGYWSDVKKVIKDQVQHQPFSLRGEGVPPVLVEVTEPMSADFLMQSMTTTYDNYVPTHDTLLSRGLDRIFGEVSKGYQETERMLSVGVRLLGIGKVALIGGKMVLEPPDDPSKHYILTTQSKKQVITELKGDARLIKGTMWVLGLLGAGLLGYLIYKNVRSLIEWMKINRIYNEIRQQREELRQRQRSAPVSTQEGSDNEDLDTSNSCVICLTNPREVVLLECGHICICVDCTRVLPEPRKCPICRGNVTRYVSVYRS